MNPEYYEHLYYLGKKYYRHVLANQISKAKN